MKIAKPETWEVHPDDYLGRDAEGREYYLFNSNVYRYTDGGATTWICTKAAWDDYPEIFQRNLSVV